MKTKKELFIINESLLDTLNEIKKIEEVLKEEDKKKLNEIQQKLNVWKRKLEDERYTIAIIGLEKAGKSTFANALLNKNFLPEAKARCTFTTAKIESSNEDYAEVQFYSQREFLDKYQELCKEIGWEENYERATFEKLEKFLESKSTAIKNSHEVDELKDILKNKNEINKYLSGEIKVFKDIQIEEVKQYIINPIKARAVKNIIIKSTQFKGDKDLVIYDVPGFDSPTKLHLEQAKQYMINSDIVIMLVSIADRVSFTKPQVDFLNDTKDQYGQKLSNKLIVVATKFDKHDDKKEIDEYRDLLIKELKNFNLYKKENFFLGSPRGYLEKNHIILSNNVKVKLEKLNMSDGIEEIKSRIKEMMKGEILQLINNSFEIDRATTYKFLAEFKQNYNPVINEKKKREEELFLIDKKWEEISSELKSELKTLYKEIDSTKYELDMQISQQVSEIWINELIEKVEQFIKEEEKNIVDGRVNIEQPQKINELVRERIYKESLEKIIKISTSIIDKENKEEYNKLVNYIKHSICENDVYEIEIEKDLKETINKIINKFSYDAKSYKPLILRFLNSVFEILILNSISNNENSPRVKRFQKLRIDIEALLQYDENYDDTYSIFKQDFIQKLLVQKIGFKSEQINSLSQLLKKATIANSYEEVKEEIITDLINLKDIFNTILLNAIKIENPFKDSLKDQIQGLLNDLDKLKESSIRKFVVRNIENIAKNEYLKLNKDEKTMKKLEFVINKINELEKKGF